MATQLRKSGVNVVLDKWDLEYGTDLAHFMETSVRESDFVVTVCTPIYAKKADSGTGGAGYEKQIVTGEMFQGANPSKFIPLVRRGSDKEALPSFLKSKNYIDFRKNSEFDRKLKDLLHQLHRIPKYPRPSLGPSPFVPEQGHRSDSRGATQGSPSLPPPLEEAFKLPRGGDPSRSASEEAEWDIEEKFDLEGGEYQSIPVETKAGTRLTGFVKADGQVTAYLLGESSLRSFDEGSGFHYEWGREDPVKLTKVSYDANQTRTLQFVVSNGYEDEDGEDFDPVSVEVRLRIEA